MDQAEPLQAIRARGHEPYGGQHHPRRQAGVDTVPSPGSDTLASEVSSLHAGYDDGYLSYQDIFSSSRAATLVSGDQDGGDYVRPKKTQDTTQDTGTGTGTGTTTWGVNWRAPSLMLASLLCGAALALGHHFHYASLDGTVVSSGPRQEWALRFGSAFAVMVQSCLVASVAVAYAQRVWVTVGRRSLTLETLDKVFSLQANIFSFLGWELLRKAKLLCLLGLCAW